MDQDRLADILEQVRSGRLDVAGAMARLRTLPFEDLGFAKVDHHRSLRCGFPEVCFCPGKTPEQVTSIVSSLARAGSGFLATRADADVAAAVLAAFPDAVYNPVARTVWLAPKRKAEPATGSVVVVSAGTSDLPVAEEARVTADAMGCAVELLADVGVAGIHRLLTHVPRLTQASAVVVVAGMEGALASVVGGLVDCPVIAVPTSVGYGASFNGLAALLAMLNSCAANVAVVNIDNGFGAGYVASLVARRTRPTPQAVKASGHGGQEHPV